MLESVTAERLSLTALPWAVVSAIVAGERLGGWAIDYPAEGDSVIAGMLNDVRRRFSVDREVDVADEILEA